MQALAREFHFCDLQFQGTPQIIATVVIQGAGGVVLIDPGPSTTLPTLRCELATAGVTVQDVRAILLTHIHLDHAGSAGTLVSENPRIRVYVHEKGVPHLVDPTKLVASATRLWPKDMERLWGEIRPLPREAITALRGNEQLLLEGHNLHVAYTPGHASHHVSYFSQETNIAFVGDAVGIRLPGATFVLPSTPPPDINLDHWRDALVRIEEWRPEGLFVTHFGLAAPAGAIIRELREQLQVAVLLAKRSLEIDAPDEARADWFVAEYRRVLRHRLPV